MAPPSSLPELTDDLIGEILLRISPDEPAHLFRTSLVCRSWRHLLSDLGFLRRYREFHGTPPVLGFLNYNSLETTTSPACPLIPPALDCYGCVALDCRHGRVLLHTIHPAGLIVWDPITGNQHHLPDAPEDPYNHLTGAVLCAADGCDHVDCGRGGPFLVVFGGTADDENLVEGDDVSFTWLSVYSSATGTWSALASAHLGPIATSSDVMGPSLLAGGALYFLLEDGRRLLRYELGRHELSVMNLPPPLRVGNMALVKAEDGGGLGVAGVEGYSLHLWSWRGAAAGWVQGRVIELDMMLPMTIGDPSTRLLVVGYSECANTIFIHSNEGIFTIEFKSDRIKHICESRDFQTITPYASFYTPGMVLASHTSSSISFLSRDIYYL